MTKITITGCLHGCQPELIGGDILILTGDYTARHTKREFEQFREWLKAQKYKHKIVVAGNHDMYLADNHDFFGDVAVHLLDQAITVEGLRIHGSPWSLYFNGIHPSCKAFTGNEARLERAYRHITKGVDILVSHGPPLWILDAVYDGIERIPRHVGSKELVACLDRVQPKLCVFSHIHESYGYLLYKHAGPNTECYNVSHWGDVDSNKMNEPVNLLVI